MPLRVPIRPEGFHKEVIWLKAIVSEGVYILSMDHIDMLAGLLKGKHLYGATTSLDYFEIPLEQHLKGGVSKLSGFIVLKAALTNIGQFCLYNLVSSIRLYRSYPFRIS